MTIVDNTVRRECTCLLSFMISLIPLMLNIRTWTNYKHDKVETQIEMQRTCGTLAVPCSAILQCTVRPLKCICCKHTAASQCRCSVNERPLMYFKGKCNALESEVQYTLREEYHWSARKCTGNALHFDLGIYPKTIPAQYISYLRGWQING